ncbi:laminin G domain-containing protein [Ditylenchus destructor]|uniref:Laminin G domain-containing protein n=1 Tax=Ditylenchus destructor TaxID=166010 RepID=A0AAD4NIB9_9BILA|nr:laminin G domain-containing protein [Ditylenchus destructor]
MRIKRRRRIDARLLRFFAFLRLHIFTLLLLNEYLLTVSSVILSGGSDSFARYPKWAQTFENQLSFEFKTRSTNALILYTDDGGIHSNFYAISIVDGKLQLGDENQDVLLKRPVIQMRVNDVLVNDNRWHKFVLFQAWENVKLQVDDTVVFKILNQRSFAFGNLRTNSDVFVGGLPKDVHQLSTMSSPLRRHSRRFAGSIKNLVYRLYPQGVSSPQLIDSYGTRQTDDDYCVSNVQLYSSGASDSAASSDAKVSHLLLEYCKNGGNCFSSNSGPKCDCGFTDYEGRQCESKKKIIPELSFFANEWLGYDLTMHQNAGSSSGTIGGAGVWSRRENLTMHFKTSSPNGLLFVAGDSQNYVQLLLERGVLLAVSKLEGSDKRIIRVFNKSLKPARFDDDVWHSVILYRDLSLPATKYTTLTMRLSVDGGWSDEVKQLTSSAEWLGNSFAYVGGAPHGRLYVPNHMFQFKGCMKKVKLEADAIQLDLIELADQGYGKSVVRTSGDLSFSCSSPAQTPDVLSFNTGQEYITLPMWNSLASGSLGFQFRTMKPDGLILYHGMRNFQNHSSVDYIAFELIDGYLFLVINLGSGYVRLQTTTKPVNEGSVWHTVAMERVGRTGSVTVDTVKTVFSTPGISANLIIEEPIFIGAAPWPIVGKSHKNSSSELDAKNKRPMQFPSSVWTAHLRQGFIGCLKNLRINGINAQIASAFEAQQMSALGSTTSNFSSITPPQKTKKRGISVGCPQPGDAMDYCSSAGNPCQNFGRCEQGHDTFKCDCSNTLFEGPTCSKKSKPVPFPLPMPSTLQFGSFTDDGRLSPIEEYPPVFRLPHGAEFSEAENFEVKFRTEDDSAVLFDTKAPYAPSSNKRDRMLLQLLNGELELLLTIENGTKHAFNWGTALNDNHWHVMRIKRRGEKLYLHIDGKWQTNRSNIGIYIEEISIGRALRRIDSKIGGELSDESQERSSFDGELVTLSFNHYDVLQDTRKLFSVIKSHELDDIPKQHEAEFLPARNRNKASPANTVSFESTLGHAYFSSRRVMETAGSFRISFRMKTLASAGLLFVMLNDDNYLDGQENTRYGEFTAVELFQARIRLTIGYWTNGAGRRRLNIEQVVTPMWHSDNIATSSGLRRPRDRLDDLRWHTINIQQDSVTSVYHIMVDNSSTQLTPSSQHSAIIAGKVFFGGIPREFSPIPEPLQGTPGYRGCFANLKLGKEHLDIWSDSHSHSGMQRNCPSPSMRCNPTACRHEGICYQGWNNIKCDCSMTTYSGPYCDEIGTTYQFDAVGSSIYYEYPAPSSSTENSPSTSNDELVLAFQTQNSNGVLLAVQCAVEDDYFTVFLGGGYLQVKYNLGSREHHLGYFDIFVNDGRRHLVKVKRRHANLTMALDNLMPIKYAPTSQRELYTLNSYWRISIGGSFNVLHSLAEVGQEQIPETSTHSFRHRRVPKPLPLEKLGKVYDEFKGNVSGVNFNGLRILDLFARGHERTHSTGNPKLIHMGAFDEPSDAGEFVKFISYSHDLGSPSSSAQLDADHGNRAYKDLEEPSGDSFFDTTPLKCLSIEATSDCEREETALDEGRFV